MTENNETTRKQQFIDGMEKGVSRAWDEWYCRWSGWNWQNILIGVVLGMIIGCTARAHDKPTLPPFESLPQLQQDLIKSKLREAELLMDMHKVSGNVLRDEMVADMIKKNPALATAIPELQIVFSICGFSKTRR